MFGAASALPSQAPPNEMEIQKREFLRRVEELYPVLKRTEGVVTPGQTGPLVSSFVTYSYNFTDNPQLLHQGNQFNPQQHVDQARWAQAMQNNPDPTCCFPEQLVGLQALEQRILKQQQRRDESLTMLKELEASTRNLRGHLEGSSSKKLEECRLRQQRLSRLLLNTVAAVETYAVMNGAARRSLEQEQMLEERFSKLEEAVRAPASARARLEELRAVACSLPQEGAIPEGTAKLSDAEAEKTLKVTAVQGDLIENMQHHIAQHNRDIAQFEGALAHFAVV